MRSLAAALKDFGAPRHAAVDAFVAPPSFAEPADFQMPDLPAFAEDPAEPAVDVDALVADAVMQAEAALSERLAKEHADALQAERDRHAEEMAELQGRFGEEAAERIVAAMQELEVRVVDLTSAVTARILGVVLTDDLRERSVERLATIIGDALVDGEAARVRVRGSLPLYEALKTRLPRHADQLDFTESPNFDLSVSIDDSVFETRLAEWSAALAEALS